MTPIEELKVEIDTLANLIQHLTGQEGIWVDPIKAGHVAINLMARGYRLPQVAPLPDMETAEAQVLSDAAIERVARTLLVIERGEHSVWEEWSDHGQRRFKDEARMVLEAASAEARR